MAFTQNNNFGSNSNGEKKKQNFRVGRIYGSDGQLDVGLYISDVGIVYGTASIKAAIGKNPSNGVTMYESGLNKDNPSVLLNTENIIALLKYFEKADDAFISGINFTLDAGRSKISFSGSDTDVKITIENKVGTKSITLSATPVGNKNVHASIYQFIEYLKIIIKKQLKNKLDPEEFSDISAGEGNDEDSPF